MIVVSPSDTGIRHARAKTDRLDAWTPGKLLWAGQLDGVWSPDKRIRAMRRRLARRAQLVRARSRAKNTEIAAVAQRIAADALSWPQVKRLMTVPGVNVIVAATFMAAVGDIRRFPDRRKLTA